jgi:hypothetical protein
MDIKRLQRSLHLRIHVGNNALGGRDYTDRHGIRTKCHENPSLGSIFPVAAF